MKMIVLFGEIRVEMICVFVDLVRNLSIVMVVIFKLII